MEKIFAKVATTISDITIPEYLTKVKKQYCPDCGYSNINIAVPGDYVLWYNPEEGQVIDITGLMTLELDDTWFLCQDCGCSWKRT